MRAALRTREMLIGGELRSARAGALFEDHDPATGELNAELPDATAADVDDAVRSARAALPAWSAGSGEHRGRLLNALADAIEARGEAIAALESADNGRPIRETEAQARVVARWYRYFAGMADKLEGRTIPVAGPYINYTRRVPVGVCAAITPWNHPLLIATKKIAPALACGNTVIVKPSELACLSVLELGRLSVEVGFPPGVLNIVPGHRAAGEVLSSHPDVDRIDVTGSTATGMAVARAAAGTLKRVGLELGGKAPAIVFADANLERSVRGLLFAAFIAQGQTCIAGARILVERSVAERVAEMLTTRIAAMRVGDPMDPTTQMGPLINPAAAERVAAAVAASRDEGARVLIGGEPAPVGEGLDPSAFLSPTLVWADDPSIGVAQEELFGPVATLIPFDDEPQALEIANDIPFGLGASVWTSDVSRAHRVAEGVRAGITWINDHHRLDPGSPWGGFKLSGYGRENGFFALDEFTEVKSCWVPTQEDPLDWYDTADALRLS